MITARLVSVCIFHGLLGYICLYHVSVFNPMESVIKSFLNSSLQRYTSSPSEVTITWLWALLNALLSLMWLLGGFFLQPLADRCGRKVCSFIAQPLFLVAGSLLMAFSKFANSFELLLFGRALAGLSTALVSFTMVYVSECFPTHLRGLAPSLMYVGNSVAICLGAVAGLFLGTHDLWPVAASLPAVAGALYMTIGWRVLPESPKYLYIKLGDEERARESIIFYHGKRADVKAVEEQLKKEADLNQTGCLKEVFQYKHLRYPFILLCVTGLALNCGGGSNIVRPYSTEIIRNTLGISESKAAQATVLYIVLPSVFISLLGPVLVWLLPHRIHLLGGLMLAELGLMFVFVVQMFEDKLSDVARSVIAILGLVFSLSGFSAAAAPILIFLPGELMPQKGRALASSARMITYAIYGATQTQLYPILQHYFGPFALLFFMVVDILVFMFLLFLLPETKGKTVDDVVMKWKEK